MKKKIHLVGIVVGLVAAMVAGAQFYPVTSFFKERGEINVFHEFAGDVELGNYTVTAVSSGTSAITAGANGVWTLSGAATTDNSGSNAQLEGFPIRYKANGIYSLTTKVDVGSTGEILFGWATSDTSLIASAPTDGVYIQFAEGALSDLVLVVRSNSATVLTKTLTGRAGDGVYGIDLKTSRSSATAGTVTVTKNGTIIGQWAVTGLTASVAMGSSFAFQSTSATGTQSANIEWKHLKATRHS